MVDPTGTTSATGAATTAPDAGYVLSPKDVTVNVYNATVRQGLANNTAAELTTRDFDISKVENDPLEKTILGVAEVRAANADLPEVRLLLQHMPGAVFAADGRTDRTVDLVLGETFESLGDPTLVTAVPIASPQHC